MENWQKVWREGIAPLLSTKSLECLKTALQTNDSRLIQNGTTKPLPLVCHMGEPINGCCALAYCGWIGDGLETIGEVEEYFARMCLAIDSQMGYEKACGYFFDWFDTTSRTEMRKKLLKEVILSLKERK